MKLNSLLGVERGVIAMAMLAMTLSACSTTASSVPSTPTNANHTAAGVGRHTSTVTSQPNPASDCGTCSCGQAADGSGATPTSDQGAPCTSDSSGTISVGGGAVGSGGTNSGSEGGSTGDPYTIPSGTLLAVQTPAPGMPCRGSDAVGVSLDDNLPLGSTGTVNDVNNMWYLYEGATLSANGIVGGQVLVGWIASTPTNYFVISNGRDANLIHNLAQQIPILGQIWTAVNNTQTGSISPALNGTQINQVFSDYPIGSTSGNGSGKCFTRALLPSQLT